MNGAEQLGREVRGVPPTRGRVSHYVRYDQPGANGRLAKAVCGQHVNPKREHAAEPTCPTCAEWVRTFETLEIG